MPQLDASSFPSQLFWLLVTFSVLYMLLARALLPRVQSVLAARAAQLQSDLQQARALKAEAEALQHGYEQALATARAESHQLLLTMQEKITTSASAAHAALDATIEQKLASSARAMQQLRDDAMHALTPIAGELAVTIAAAFAAVHAPRADADALVADFMRIHTL